ncbi:molybdopterin cofactor-binding domain-containing protein [Paractinoplanes atraurantiacus]|uniref:Hydroxymethylcytosylglucuronate/cytosylglucuronate synthase n=1 Tax=Paractinoplanes atraurantiacus TaxID=1036182 RepID=A0A285IZV9_9ACTN|nr:molybdopterin cofactor-binding domain-containing protein [Actinoplanes atraurantiacus]SNY53589.1 hydroxymethylcytosylglucuronate/cytosylglucuronate synthase [Actinoplanes atraurantiacus]
MDLSSLPRGAETARKASGRAPFVLDAAPASALHARLIRARGPHSRVAVDTAAIGRMPGVVAVLGPQDDPGRPYSANPHGARADMAVFTAEARFPGDVVGAVVAPTREAAAAAVEAAAAAGAGLSEVALPAVLTVDQALDANAPPAHRGFPGDGNVLATLAFGAEADATAAAIAASAHVFDHTYRTAATTHAFLEPIAATAAFDAEGHCRIRSSTQCPAPSLTILAGLLGIAEELIEYEPVVIGGSFGGKEEFLLDAAAALCSRAVGGRPVVLATDRREMTAQFRLRHPASVRVLTGCDRTGRMTARLIEATVEGGPYAVHTPSVTANGLTLAMSMYPAPVVRATGTSVALNRVPGGAYRGYGGPQVLFAVESQIDEMARALDLDPIELRARNALRPGGVDPVHRWRAESYDMIGCLDLARDLPPLEPGTRGPRYRRGRGLAALANVSGVTGALGIDESQAECVVRDGRVVVTTSVPDVGQGLHTLLQNTVAETLGLPPVLVEVAFDVRGGDRGIYASRGTYLTANAVQEAALDLKRRLPAAAGPVTGAVPGSWAGLRGRGVFRAPDNALVAGVQVADVEVDMDTGQVEVLRVTSIHDAGRVLQAGAARGQAVGGVVQGLGNAMLEELPFAGTGEPYETSMYALGVPRATWPVEVDVVFTEGDRLPAGPLAAKGLGESPVMAVAPAVAAALHDAAGIRLRETPFTSERVWRALRSREGKAVTDRTRTPFGLVVHGNPFGWGSMGKINHVLARLPEARPVLLGESLGHEILAEGLLAGSYPDVADLSGPEAREILRRHEIEVALVANDPLAADQLISLGCPVVFIDSLPFLWTDADPMPSSEAAYCAQQTLALPVAAGAALLKVEPITWVGAIVPESSTVASGDTSSVVINVGGLESPFGRNLGDSYLTAVLPPLLEALARHGDPVVHLCGNISWDRLKELGIDIDRLTSVGIRSAEEFDALVATSGLTVTSPGLTTLLQALRHRVPVLTLPPQNVSQVMNAETFWSGQPSVRHMNWPDGVIDWSHFAELRRQGEEVTVRYMYERVRQSAHDEAMQQALRTEAKRVVDMAPVPPEPLLLDILGTTGAEEVAAVIRARRRPQPW